MRLHAVVDVERVVDAEAHGEHHHGHRRDLEPDLELLHEPVTEEGGEGEREVGEGGRLLLSTFRYDPSVMSGPPFSIEHAEVEQAYPTARVIDGDDTVPPKFAERGHGLFEQRLWLAQL